MSHEDVSMIEGELPALQAQVCDSRPNMQSLLNRQPEAVPQQANRAAQP